MAGLSPQEIMKVVNQYIGGTGGYLGDFSYSTHSEFYPEYCNLEIIPNNIDGTTRQRFLEILKSQQPADQASILRGVVERFSIGGEGAPSTRTEELKKELLDVARSWIRDHTSYPIGQRATA